MPFVGLLTNNFLTTKVEANSGFSFPWKAGTSWTFKQGFHGVLFPGCQNNPVTNSRCAIDFGTISSNVDVLAMADGTIQSMKKCTKSAYAIVNHGGTVIEYVHLDSNNLSSNLKVGAILKKGDFMGKIALGDFNEDCGYATGWTATTGHLHLVIPSNNFVIDGWTFKPDKSVVSPTGQVYGSNTINYSIQSNNSKQISPVVACRPDTSCPVYRFYDPVRRRHFYTISADEKNNLEMYNPNWKFERVAYFAHNSTDGNGQTLNVRPVYRFWSSVKQAHFYTINESEKNAIIASNSDWKYERIAYYAFASQLTGTVPLYRFWSNEYQTHFFTASAAEKGAVIAANP